MFFCNYSENNTGATGIDLSELSEAISSPLVKMLAKTPVSGRSARGRKYSVILHPENSNESMPHPTNYWLAQSDPNYAEQEDTEVATTHFSRKNSQTSSSEAYLEYMQSQSVNQKDLNSFLKETFPEVMSSEGKNIYKTNPRGAKENPFYPTGIEMAFASNTTAPLSLCFSLERGIQSQR